jgi:hypothetical protein
MARLYTDYTLSSRKQLFYYTQKCMGDPEPKKWGFSGTQWVREPTFWVTMGSFCKILSESPFRFTIVDHGFCSSSSQPAAAASQPAAAASQPAGWRQDPGGAARAVDDDAGKGIVSGSRCLSTIEAIRQGQECMCAKSSIGKISYTVSRDGCGMTSTILR